MALTYIEMFTQACARRIAERIVVERIDETTVRLRLGTREVDVPMDQLIMRDAALGAISTAVESLFGVTSEGDVSRET